MVPKSFVGQLLTEIGPLLDLEAVVAFEKDDLWTLALDEDTVLLVDYDEAAGQLLISSEVAALSTEGKADLLETLLIYNNQRQKTGGVHMALDGPDGKVIQALDLAVAELEASKLTQVLQNFFEVLRGWRDILNGSAKKSTAKEKDKTDGIGFDRGIRV